MEVVLIVRGIWTGGGTDRTRCNAICVSSTKGTGTDFGDLETASKFSGGFFQCTWRFIMSEFQSSNFKKENGGTPDLLGKTELTSPYFFVPPSGDTASRPQSCAAGTLRFNTDIGTLEVYRGDTIGWESNTEKLIVNIRRRNILHGTGTRGLFSGGDP